MQTDLVLEVMSFNVRNSGAPDGPNAWPHRKQLLFDTVRRIDADVMGFQEVLADQQADLIGQFPDYHSVSVGRDDGVNRGEFASIFLRANRFDMLRAGTFWLSQHPDQVGSIGWDASLPRICTWASVRDRTVHRELLLANTHFDHLGELARLNSARLLAKKLPELADGSPILLTGDFNCTEDAPPYHVLLDPEPPAGAKFADCYRDVRPERETDEASYHGFEGTVAGSRIDWIFHTPQFTTLAAEIDRTKSRQGRYPSDHYPVRATLEWKN